VEEEVAVYFQVLPRHLGAGVPVSIVPDYRLDDRVSIPGRGKGFSSSLCASVQNGCGAHPISCTMGTGGPFAGGKARPRRDADHSPPSSRNVLSLPPCSFMVCSGTALLLSRHLRARFGKTIEM
jgi:hypothetical protein